MNDSAQNKPCAVALGSFDGLHIGHQAVISAARSFQSAGLAVRVLSFFPHPQAVLSGQAPPELLTAEKRRQLLLQLGAEPLTLDFSAIKNLPPAVFLEEILVRQLGARALCCGYNYHFGSGGQADAAALAALCEAPGLRLAVSEAVTYGGAPVSATRIRACIAEGDIPRANAMLGRAFSYDFPVVSGDRRGRLLGAPTINQLFPEAFIVPRRGVYASRTFVENSWYASVTNIGSRPTFAAEDLRSETCILGFSGDLYGQNIEVALLDYLRPEQKFASVEALKVQIAADARQAEAQFTADA